MKNDTVLCMTQTTAMASREQKAVDRVERAQRVLARMEHDINDDYSESDVARARKNLKAAGRNARKVAFAIGSIYNGPAAQAAHSAGC